MTADSQSTPQADSARKGHTPGPWTLAKQPPACGLTVTLYGNCADKRLGTLHTGSWEYMSNARLIAAAPELLEALEGITKHYVDLVNSGDCGFWNPEEKLFVMDARAAIRKATGHD